MAYGTTARKKSTTPFNGFLQLKRSGIEYLLKKQRISHALFGVFVSYLALSTWDFYELSERKIRSDAKMAKLAGGNRATWQRRRKKLIALGLIEERGGGNTYIAHFIRYVETGVSETQQDDEESQHIDAVPYRRDAISHQSEPFGAFLLPPKSGSTKTIIEASVAEMQQSEIEPDTSKKITKDTLSNTSRVAAKKRRQTDQRKRCEKCNQTLQGMEIVWAARYKRTLCEACREKSV